MQNKIHKAKKSLGQNFLKSVLALNKIVEAGELKKEDTVLEIGPGKGALTEKLLATGCTVIAVEKDNDLLEYLKEKFSTQIASRSLILVHDDILKFDITMYISQSTPWRRYKIIANIPYNITGAILKKFLTEKNQPSLMVLMVQHEVAKRIIGNNPRHSGVKKESILSISVKAYGEPKMIMKVAARYFSPAPKVDSAVIQIKNISRKLFHGGVASVVVNEEKFWELIHAGFAHKRKKLSGNLKNYIGKASEINILEKMGLQNARAEDLQLEDWIALLKML